MVSPLVTVRKIQDRLLLGFVGNRISSFAQYPKASEGTVRFSVQMTSSYLATDVPEWWCGPLPEGSSMIT